MTAGDPSRRPDPDDLFTIVDHLDVPGGGRVTVEPGGQVELSSRPHAGVAAAIEATAAGVEGLRSALGAAGVHTAALGLDPTRPSRRIVSSPRYDAMEAYFECDGGAGLSMMCATASVQVNLDLGDPAERGPPLAGGPRARAGACRRLRQLAAGRRPSHGRQVVPPAGVGRARPHPVGAGALPAPARRRLGPLRAGRPGHAHPGRRHRLPAGPREPDVRGVDGGGPRARLPDGRRLRLPPHDPVPAGAPQGLARAADDRRPSRARGGRWRWRSRPPSSTTPRRSTRPSAPAGRSSTAGARPPPTA